MLLHMCCKCTPFSNIIITFLPKMEKGYVFLWLFNVFFLFWGKGKVRIEKWKLKSENWKVKAEKWKLKSENLKLTSLTFLWLGNARGELKVEKWKLKNKNFDVNIVFFTKAGVSWGLDENNCLYFCSRKEESWELKSEKWKVKSEIPFVFLFSERSLTCCVLVYNSW